MLTTSCVNLSQIDQFSRASQNVGSSFRSLSESTVETCRSTAAGFFPPNHAPINCDRFVKTEPEVVKVNDALFAYITALGKLAALNVQKAAVSVALPNGTMAAGQAGNFTNIGTQLSAVDTSFTKTQATQANAAGFLTTTVTKLVLSGYQRHALARLIHENNESVVNVTTFLSDYAVAREEQVLNNSWTLEEQYCNSNRNLLGDNEPLAAKLLKRQCAQDKAAINTKLAAVEQYKKALAIIAQTHTTLDQHRNHLNAKELLIDIGPEVAAF